jgi:hypothetical protein
MKEIEIEKLRQLVSRTDMTGNQKVDWLVNFIDKREQALRIHDVVGRSEQLICPECENPYPHSHTDGSYSCEDCGHKWAN